MPQTTCVVPDRMGRRPVIAAPATGRVDHVLLAHEGGWDEALFVAVPDAGAVVSIDMLYHGQRPTNPPGESSGTGFFTSNMVVNRLNGYQGAIDLWKLLDLEREGEVLQEVGDDLQSDLLSQMDRKTIRKI